MYTLHPPAHVFFINNINELHSKSYIDQQVCPTSDFKALIEYENNLDSSKYLVTDHLVETSDGYLLKIFNVKLKPEALQKLPKKLRQNSTKLVLLQHAWVDSADSMFFAGKNSVGIHLVDLGFDVWVGNNRGNKYSRRSAPNFLKSEHGVYKNFFDYSFQEMGVYDQTAIYKYLTKIYPEKAKLEVIFLGISQGTAQMFAGLSDEESSEFLTKHTKKFIAAAPVVFLNHTPSYALQAVGKALSQYSM